MENYKILIIEDDQTIATQIESHLTTWGYEVSHVMDFRQVMEVFHEFGPHLVLLDISLPFYNGFYWCTEMRKESKVPIIFISSAAENMNIVMAMNMGGDDFVAKPFDLQVLSAKIQALLRRSYDFMEDRQVVSYGNLMLDMNGMQITHQGKKLPLTKNEFLILQLLMKHKGQVVTREEMMKALWEDECFVDDNTLAVNMARLRKKLQEDGVEDLIQTKKGVGYLLA